MDRRKLLSLTATGVGAVAFGVVALPVLVDSLSPLISDEPKEEWKPVGQVDEFAIGGITKSIVSTSSAGGGPDKTAVYVWRRSDDSFVVYSRSCTDLGCPVVWDPGSEWFYCPCHGGVFDKEGERKAGPPRRPLWRYQTRIRNRALEINLFSVPPMA